MRCLGLGGGWGGSEGGRSGRGRGRWGVGYLSGWGVGVVGEEVGGGGEVVLGLVDGDGCVEVVG